MLILGPIPGLFMNKYGQQMITMIGGLVAGIGLIFSAYATNAYYLAASFGVVTGKPENIVTLPR